MWTTGQFSTHKPDVASGVRPETKPRLREPKKRKKKRQSWTFFTLINSFNFKDEHYNNISRRKRFGGVFFLLWNRPSYFPPYWVCFDLVTMSCLACVAGAWNWWAQERTRRARETHISSRARSLSRLTSKCLLHSYMSRWFQAPP